MTLSADRLRVKIEDIAQAAVRLRRIEAMGREAFLADEDSRDIARWRLLTAMEASLNICYHACARRLRAVPEDYAQCFVLLAEAGLLPSDLAVRLSSMACFRNRLVHLYWDVDYGQVFDFLPAGISDLEAFARHTALWL
jgi:uncharacterized protein YutE (UPF0331/DUF86 family)